jgi:hypothetical protein
MGGFCTQSYENIPSYTESIEGTTLPAWVSAGGKALFENAAAIASSPYPQYSGQRIASYDGSKLTPEEQRAARILSEGAGSYEPYLNEAERLAQGLGQGYDSASRSELLGPAYQGASRSELLGDYQGASRQDLIGDYQGASRQDLIGDYQGATREELLGDPFSLESAQPFLDMYQGAADPAVREVERQTALAQNAARASAAKSGAFGGSRLGISEAMLGSEGATAAGDLRARAAQEGLGFAANRFDTDRAGRFQAEQTMRAGAEADRAARFGAESALRSGAEADRSARFGAESAMRSGAEADRSARFGAESAMRGQYDTDRSARFGAEDALRSAYTTEEGARLQQQSIYQSMGPMIQGLQEQAAAGLISTGEARRKLDQMALNLAYGDYEQQRAYPQQMVNFALGALQGTPYNTTSYGNTLTQQYAAQPSIYGQSIGALGTGLAAYYAGRN